MTHQSPTTGGPTPAPAEEPADGAATDVAATDAAQDGVEGAGSAARTGSLAPWLAHSVLADVAQALATATWAAIAPPPADAPRTARVVLVTDDPDLLATDLVSRQVRTALQGRIGELTGLTADLVRAAAGLREAVARYEAEEAGRDERRAGSEDAPTRDLVGSVLGPVAGVAAAAAEVAADRAATAPAAEAEESPGTSGEGPIATAVELVRLLAVDRTVTAVDVTADSALLARLTAGRLAAADGHGDDHVLLDGFAPADDSATFAAYAALVDALGAAGAAARRLRRAQAPVDAEAGEYRLALTEVRASWERTVADDQAAPGAAGALEEAVDELTRRVQARTAAAAPAEDLVGACTALVQAVRDELRALTTADGRGLSPLQRACSRDRLHDRTGDGTLSVTHVLLVRATHAGADVVTRHSVLGDSGRIGYLGGANAAWVLIDVTGTDVTGTVRGGGAVDSASQITHDVATGESRRSLVRARDWGWTSTDPLERNERWLRAAVLLLALAFALLGAAATVAAFL